MHRNTPIQHQASTQPTHNPQDGDLAQQPSNDHPTRPTRVIKTRSMTSAKPTTSAIAFGASIPQRKITKPLPRRKQPPAAQKNPRAELKDNQLALNQNSSQPSLIDQPESNKPSSKSKPSTSPPVVVVQTSVEYKRSKAAKAEQKENQPDTDSVLAPLPIRHQSQAQLPLTADPIQSSSYHSSTQDPGPSLLGSGQPVASSSTGSHSDASKVPSTSRPPLDRPPTRHPNLRPKPPSVVVSDQKLNLPGKRLFEEIDSGSQDIFSFLDNKPQRLPKNLVKSSTRPVFKPNQPLYLKNTRPGAGGPAPEAEAPKRKPRALASSKLLAGTQPQKKRLKPNSTHPPSTSLAPLPPNPPASVRLPNINLEDFDLKGVRKQPTQPAQLDSQAPLISKPAELSATSPHITETKRASRTPSPAPSATRVQSSDDDCTGKASGAFLSARPTTTTLSSPKLTPTTQRAPVKRAFEARSIHPLPASPLTQNPARVQKDDALVEDTSADDIDFLSPKKKSKASPDAETNAQGILQAAEKSPVPASVPVPDARPQLDVTGAKEPTEKETNVASQPERKEPRLERESARASPTSSGDAEAASHSRDADAAPVAVPGAQSAADPPPQSGVCPVEPLPTMDSSSTTPPMSPSSPSILLAALTGRIAQPRLDQPATPESKAVRDPTPSPRPSPKLIPTRTSPIKHATLPTSIPILKATPAASRKLVGPGTTPTESSLPAPVITQPPRRPSMLPRRALKPSMGTRPPVTFNAISNLDAIVEASPEKRPTTRDAMSAASLNLSRGAGEPRRMIFSGGIKTKGAEAFGWPADAGRAVFGRPTEAGPMVFGRPAVAQQATSASASTSTSAGAEPTNQAATGGQSAEGALTEEEPAGEMSSVSIASHHSFLSASSSSSRSSSSSSSTLANTSQETQDRLSKLKGLLNGLSTNRPNESGVGGKSVTRGVHQVNTIYVDSEVPLKDSQEPVKGKARRRSSSVPTAASQTCGAGSSSGSGVLKTSQAAGHERAGSRQVSRRVSNILPSARIEQDGSRTDKREGGAGGGRRMKKETALKDVVAFVDVRTAEGDDAGKIFVEMLKGLGAKVIGRPTFPLTHIIFKAGKQATVDRWLSHPRPKPFLVGIGWIVRCRELVGRAGEEPYLIDINGAQAPLGEAAGLRASVSGGGAAGPSGTTGGGGAGNRRKSMEPKALALLNSTIQIGGSHHQVVDSRHPLSRSCIGKVSTSSGGPVADPSAVLEESIARARRKSLQFLPKVGSPLANKVFSLEGEEDEESG